MKAYGRDKVIEVFGDACPVCGHSVTGAHRIDESCQLCGVECGNRPWPAKNVQRWQEYRGKSYGTRHYHRQERTVSKPTEAEFHAQLAAEGIEVTTVLDDDLWALASKWYDIAANEAVDTGTRHGYRECANQLEDALADRTVNRHDRKL